MLNEAAYYLKVISTFSVLPALVVGFWYFKTYDSLIKWFITFLVVGLFIDLGGWFFYTIGNQEGNIYLRHAYALFETLFLFGFIGKLSPDKLTKQLFTHAWMVVLPFWVLRFYFITAMSVFKTSTQVFIAFGACFIILRMVEVNHQIIKQVVFWLLLGVFFYCFSTYFIMGMLATHLSKVWYTHNLINILTNLIYLVGFLKTESFSKKVVTR